MTQTQPRFAFVNPELRTITVHLNGQPRLLETNCTFELADLAPLAINAAIEEETRVLLVDRETGKKIDFHDVLTA
ncbi:hypothetical protein [Vibrio sinaloensis]|uniref:hypothetical protein n=1 Tax=Photobacterium sp. (strain ATCC 43367) TaxID=379097 RepID=UPI002F3E9C62